MTLLDEPGPPERRGEPERSPLAATELLRAAGRPDMPIKRRRVDRADLADAGIASLASLALAGTARAVLDWQGLMSTAVWWYLLFLLGVYLLIRDRASREIAVDRVVTVLIWSAAATVVAMLGWMLVFLVIRGAKLFRPGFFTADMATTGPNDPGGGARHAILGSIEQVGVATVVVVPIAVMTAVYLHEVKGRLAPVVRFIVDAMSGLPSIVAGLLVYTVWVVGHGFSGVAGAAALSILMLPIVTRTSEEILRTIPDSLREASLALGAPQWRVVLRVVLPTASSGLLTAAILGVARAVGETAPLLLTSLGSSSTNTNLLRGPQSALPLFVYNLVREPNIRQNQRAFTGVLILVFLVFVLFAAARLISGRGQRKLGRPR